MQWQNIENLSSKAFKCGYCGENVSSEKGYSAQDGDHFIYICHHCTNPTYFNLQDGKQYPGVAFGNKVENIPENIENLYSETRQCVSVQAFTASVMASRKLLMNIAVEKGAKEGLSFQQYVEYLDSQHYIPPDGKEWVDHIREKGNEANHEIKIMEKEDAEDLITFIEMLLKFIYEFPNKVKQKQQSI